MTRAVDLDLPTRPRILVITMRRLGDVLLTTALVRSIRRGFPDACLDMLVFRGSDAILAGNPDIDHVLTMAERPTMGENPAPPVMVTVEARVTAFPPYSWREV